MKEFNQFDSNGKYGIWIIGMMTSRSYKNIFYSGKNYRSKREIREVIYYVKDSLEEEGISFRYGTD